MARGKPILWSSLIGVPFVLVGIYVVLEGLAAPLEAAPFVCFGVVVVGIGLYLRAEATVEPPPLRDGEELVLARHPTQRVARTKMAASVPFLVTGFYLLFFTYQPYVFPTAAFAVGLYFYGSGANTYWGNTVTTYYLTTERLIKEYRFLSVAREEVPLDEVRAVEERKSVIEHLVGLGHVRVASGHGRTLEVVSRDLDDPGEFAEAIRSRI